MKKYWQAIGITVVAAGILVYPAIRLYQYIAKRRAEGAPEEEEEHHIKAFAPAYRGKHKPHHRHTHNGHAGPDIA
ncbi:MAG: hypothetical protein JWQ38_3312 [Flavipsychrobacter sp.]|nr:hypothetical protein [Flavipsychrobacter sp.]